MAKKSELNGQDGRRPQLLEWPNWLSGLFALLILAPMAWRHFREGSLGWVAFDFFLLGAWFGALSLWLSQDVRRSRRG